MSDRIWIPHLQVRSHSVVVFDIPEPPFNHKRTICQTKYTGRVTASTAKRIRQAIDILLQLSPKRTVWNPITQAPTTFRLTFLTLTVSQDDPIDARDGYRLGLSPFLDWMRKKGNDTYIWKAELQQRGQLHYHITTNQFIRFDDIKNKWNALQRAAGWLEGYKSKYGHYHPNSTDIHAVRKIKRLDWYLCKYMAKQNTGAAINGKVWGCSQRLQGKKYHTEVFEPDNEFNMIEMHRTKKGTKLKLDHCTIFDTAKPLETLTPAQNQRYLQWLKT